MKLEIILRTCDRTNVSKHPRFISVSKSELLLGCVASLINSANQVKGHIISYKILDDNSTQETQEKLRKLFSQSIHSYEFIKLNETGHHYTALKQFEYCRDSNADFVYSVEDDYLHCPSALTEVFDEILFLPKKYPIQKPLCLFLWDNIREYCEDDFSKMRPEMIMRGKHRHWKSGLFTTFSMITHPFIFQQHWDLFHKLATEYTPFDEVFDGMVYEGNTISKIWLEHVFRISPLNSLALHMQDRGDEDSYIDWRYWWKNYTTISKPKLKYS